MSTHHFKIIKKIIPLIFITIIGNIVLFGSLSYIPPAVAAPTELFFSEYVEGTGNNKALEIFNGTNTALNLLTSNYDIQLFLDGSNIATITIPLTGIITAGDVYVIAHSNSAPSILAQADQLSNNLSFDGNDTVVLRRNRAIIDSIGQIGFNPGQKWGVLPTSTQNNTLRRKFFISTGDANSGDIFNPTTEWTGFAVDTFSGLGTHSTIPPTLTVVINEIAWAGTAASSRNEWLELYNPGSDPIDITNWTIRGNIDTQQLNITLNGIVPAGGYFLLEQGGDNSISNIIADQLYNASNSLDNFGETLQLKEPGGAIIDTANSNGGSWPAGIAAPKYISMERINPTLPDSDTNWRSNDTITRNGRDANLTAINGTPKQPNSALPPLPTPTLTPTSIISPTFTPTLTPTIIISPTFTPTLTPTVIISPTFTPTLTPTVIISPTFTPTFTPTVIISPTFTPTPPPPALILISEFLYDGLTPASEGDEFVELCNPNNKTVDLTGYKIGDEELKGGRESMYRLPVSATLIANYCFVIAKNAAQFQNRFGRLPDFELVTSGRLSDTLTVPNLSKYTVWGSGSWALANNGDEILLLSPNDQILDSVAYRNGDYASLALEPGASAPTPHSLQRIWSVDTNSMPYDFVRTDPTPGKLTKIPAPPAVPPAIVLPNGMHVYWGHLHAHTTYSDGAGPPYYALALARAAGLDFYAITDHGWWLSETEWANTISQTTVSSIPGQFIALRGVEWSHNTAGHIGVFNSNTLLQRTNPALANLSDFYNWLTMNPNAIAQFNHPDPKYGGTFNNFALYPAAVHNLFMQEIGNNAQQYSSYETSFIQSNSAGWKVAPVNNGDTHTAKWGTDTLARTGIIAPALTETDLLEAMRSRRIFATEDSNLALTLRSGKIWMGSVLSNTDSLTMTVNVIDPDSEPITVFLYDGNKLLTSHQYTAIPNIEWTVTAKTAPGHFFWVKAVQDDGDTAYSSPFWIEGKLSPDKVYINELLPSPKNRDWNGDGIANYDDEWTELFNPLDRVVNIGGWKLGDSSHISYNIPLSVTIPARGFVTFHKTQAGFALNNGGDTVTLTRPDGSISDTFSYISSPGYDESWCRLPDGSTDWNDNCDPSPNEKNREKPAAAPLSVSIYEAKQLTPRAWVKIKGRVTAPPGLLGNRNMYIQDDSAGILIYLPKYHDQYNLGDKVEVVGNLRIFYGEFEIVVRKASGTEFLEAGFPPLALPIATTSMLEPYEGRLIRLQGQAVRFRGRTIFWVDDGSDQAKVLIRSGTKIRKPFIKAGTPITITGIVSQRSGKNNISRNDYRLLPRYQYDLIIPDIPPVSADWPAFLPNTGD